jgi:sugar lactone lactonase YvrE
LVLERLDDRICPVLTLTPDGIARGIGISIFAVDFPSQGGKGPLGVAYPRSGGVLVTDDPGNIRLFPTDTDGQSAAWYTPAQFYGFENAVDLAQTPDGAIYMTQYTAGQLVQLNDDGTFYRSVVDITTATGLAANPTNGHLYVSSWTTSTIWEVDPATGEKSEFAPYLADGMTVSADGSTLYATSRGHILGFDTTSPTHDVVFDSGFIEGGPDGVAEGTGPQAGKLYVNTNTSYSQDHPGGNVVEVDITTHEQTPVADHGSRGDFVTVDPYNGSVLVTQTDRLVRLTFPTGGGGGGSGGGAAPTARLGQRHLAVALAQTDLPLSQSPANGLPLLQPVGEHMLSPREQQTLAGSTSDSQPGFTARYALDALFATHRKDGQHMDPEDLGAFALGFTSALN